MYAKPWPRTSLATLGGQVKYSLICVSPVQLDLTNGSPASVQGWATAGELRQTVDITVDRSPWNSSLGEWISQYHWTDATCEPALRPVIPAMKVAYFVEVDEPDLSDLGTLQDAWACAHWLISIGATAVLDRTAERWWSAEAVFSWGKWRTFSIEHEVAFIMLEHPTFEFVASRGMAKFCRPDVLLHMPKGLPEPMMSNARQLIRHVCHRLAMGEVIAAGMRVNNGFLSADVLPFRVGRLNLPFSMAEDSLVLAPVLKPDTSIEADGKRPWWRRLLPR
jgi:hypothetical protein